MNENPSEGFDLDVDLADIDTSYPSASVGEHACRIVKASVAPWKNTPENKSLVVQLATEQIVTSTKGDDLMPGYKMNFRLNLQQGYDKQGEPIGDYKKDMARFLDAVFNNEVPRRRFNQETINSMVGQMVTAVVKARKDSSDGFGETEVKFLKEYK